MLDEHIQDLLYQLVKGFGGLPLDKFELKYTDEVGEPADEVCTRVLSLRVPKLGLCSLWVLRGGLTVVNDSKDGWSLYESRERVEEREYLSRWAAYPRGAWVDAVPQIEGVFAVRDREGRRGHDRTLKRVGGRLVDVTRAGGFVGGSKTTEYRGQWWSLPLPPLKGAI